MTSELSYEITVVTRDGNAVYLCTEYGDALWYESVADGTIWFEFELSGNTIAEARRLHRRNLFAGRVGIICNTRAFNKQFEEWEVMQTFNEKLVLPKGQQQKLDKALTDRKKADEAKLRADASRKEVIICLTQELGMSFSEVGSLLGLSKMRVCQISKEQ